MSNEFYTNVGQMDGYEVVTLGYGSKLQAKIAPTEGNNLFSLRCGDTEIIHYDKTKPLADFLTGTPVLFPFPNRIEDAMWQWQGKTRLQKKNGVPVWLHSLVYDEKSWTYDAPEVTESGALLRTRLDVDESHPIYSGYPFRFALCIKYRLSDTGLEIKYIVDNKSDDAMPYGFAIHPYFRRIGQTRITLPAKSVYETRDNVDPMFLSRIAGGFGMIPNILPTGTLADVKGSRYDLTKPSDVDTLDLDDVYTDIAGDAVIDYPEKRLKVLIASSDEINHTVVYTPPEQPFFCIEPQTCATDAVNLHARGTRHAHLMVLDAGAQSEGKISLTPVLY